MAMNKNYISYFFLKPFKSWKNKYLKYVTKKEAKLSNLYVSVAKEIGEYTGESIDIVKEKHKTGAGSENAASIFKEQASLDKVKVENFYKSCQYYLYELPLWNAERNRPKYLRLIFMPYLKRNQYKKVMDFGAGAGDLCIELAKNKLEVTYCDIGECLFSFAKWRFARRNLSVKMVNAVNILGEEKFDCIFSFDAFEHIKNLQETLKKLTEHIKIGGSLVFSGAFSGGSLHLEENERFNDFKNLDSLMQGLGLTFQDKFAQYYFYKRKNNVMTEASSIHI